MGSTNLKISASTITWKNRSSQDEIEELSREMVNTFLGESREDVHRFLTSNYSMSESDLISSVLNSRSQLFNTLMLVETIKEASDSICSALEKIYRDL